MTAVKEFGEGLGHMENINANWPGGRRVLRRRQWTSLALQTSIAKDDRTLSSFPQ